jgi:hypothetical protein
MILQALVYIGQPDNLRVGEDRHAPNVKKKLMDGKINSRHAMYMDMTVMIWHCSFYMLMFTALNHHKVFSRSS